MYGWFLVFILLLAVGLVGCGGAEPTTQTLEPTLPLTNTPVPPATAQIDTPMPQSTDTPIPSPVPSTDTPHPPPQAPVIDVGNGITVVGEGEITVDAGEEIIFRASAEGAEQYEWELVGIGEIPQDATDRIITYTAPEEGDGRAILTVTAYNDGGASPPTDLTIVLPQMASIGIEALNAVPAGWMSGGSNPESYISLDTSNDCPTGSGCLQVTYEAGGVWGGIFWWPISCGESGTPAAWDRVQQGTCGVNVLDMGQFSTVDRVSFWARGDQGGETIEFKVGAADVSPIPGRSLGKVTLTSEWQRHEIDLQGANMTDAIGLFAWIAADLDNPQGAIFYLDDIQYEGNE